MVTCEAENQQIADGVGYLNIQSSRYTTGIVLVPDIATGIHSNGGGNPWHFAQRKISRKT